MTVGRQWHARYLLGSLPDINTQMLQVASLEP